MFFKKSILVKFKKGQIGILFVENFVSKVSLYGKGESFGLGF
jgi:hypothetical protein